MSASDIHIAVKSTFIPEQSRPGDKHYVYAYTITITNEGARAARLISRRWRVCDAHEKIQEVEGEGVVGEQPRLEPGEDYTYTSGVVLETETGTMEGSYQMQRDSGEIFDAMIPLFALVPPDSIH